MIYCRYSRVIILVNEKNLRIVGCVNRDGIKKPGGQDRGVMKCTYMHNACLTHIHTFRHMRTVSIQ